MTKTMERTRLSLLKLVSVLTYTLVFRIKHSIRIPIPNNICSSCLNANRPFCKFRSIFLLVWYDPPK